jgi:hypothetical protein
VLADLSTLDLQVKPLLRPGPTAPARIEQLSDWIWIVRMRVFSFKTLSPFVRIFLNRCDTILFTFWHAQRRKRVSTALFWLLIVCCTVAIIGTLRGYFE